MGIWHVNDESFGIFYMTKLKTVDSRSQNASLSKFIRLIKIALLIIAFKSATGEFQTNKDICQYNDKQYIANAMTAEFLRSVGHVTRIWEREMRTRFW